MSETGTYVWPVSVRIIHWALALTIILDAFFFEDDLHNYLGYLGATLVLLRLILGLTGKEHVRLSSLPLRLTELKAYFKNHFIGQAHDEGHNPAASVVYLLMWLVVILLAVTGWMMGLDAYWGDETLHMIHSWLSNGLLVLVLFHLIGIILDAIIYKRQTWMAMISGKKPHL